MEKLLQNIDLPWQKRGYTPYARCKICLDLDPSEWYRFYDPIYSGESGYVTRESRWPKLKAVKKSAAAGCFGCIVLDKLAGSHAQESEERVGVVETKVYNQNAHLNAGRIVKLECGFHNAHRVWTLLGECEVLNMPGKCLL